MSDTGETGAAYWTDGADPEWIADQREAGRAIIAMLGHGLLEDPGIADAIDSGLQSAHVGNHDWQKTAGPLTLHERGISFAVDETGQVIRDAKGMPVDGAAIERFKEQSGSHMTNAQAAAEVLKINAFVDSVMANLTPRLVGKKVLEGDGQDETRTNAYRIADEAYRGSYGLAQTSGIAAELTAADEGITDVTIVEDEDK